MGTAAVWVGVWARLVVSSCSTGGGLWEAVAEGALWTDHPEEAGNYRLLVPEPCLWCEGAASIHGAPR